MSSSKHGSGVSATATIPFAYRLILTTIEPLLAVGGAALVLTAPAKYLATMTRERATFTSDSTFLYTGLGGSWLYFAFVEGIVLRKFDDQRLWRLLCAGMLLSDIPFCHSVAQAVGGWAAWLRIGDWTVEDHVAFWTTAPMVLTRILVILGVGVKTGIGHSKKD